MTVKQVFIVGSSRSGTTMLNRILGRHPQIAAENELHWLGRRFMPTTERTVLERDAARRLGAECRAVMLRGIWGDGPNHEDEAWAAAALAGLADTALDGWAVFEAVLGARARELGRPVITDQTPRNVFFARDILEHLPNALVVHMVRDPRAVLESQRNRWRRRFLGATQTPWWNTLRVFFNYHPLVTTQVWKRSVLAGEAVQDHPRYLRIRFEDLVADPEASLRRLCLAAGVEFRPEMLDVALEGSSNFANDAQRRGIAPEVASAWRSRLPPAHAWIAQTVARGIMDRYGYERMSMGIPWLGLLGQALLLPIHAIGVIITNPRLALLQLRALTRTKVS